MKYGPEDDGREINLNSRDEFEINLPETRTAGYKWTADTAPDPTYEMLGDQSEVPTGTTGGSGLHHFHFRARNAGSGEIKLHYGRAWDQEKGPEKTFTLKVHVRP
jgi:inhibitor of cysteine peptidase